MVNTRLLSQAKSLKYYRAPNSYACIGTSRLASQFLDPPINGMGRNYGNASWINWAMAYLRKQNKPMQLLGNFAVSGTRTDQFNVAAVLAMNPLPSFVILDGPINDIAQQFPAAGTVVATAVANLKSIVKQLNDAGITIFYVWERGATNFTTTMIGNLNDINAQLGDYFQYGDDFRGPPDLTILNPVPYSTTTSSNGAIAVINSIDGTHDNITGGQKIAQAFYPLMAPYLSSYMNHHLDSLNTFKSGLGTRSMVQSAGLTGSLAASGTGNTGTLATNMFFGNCTGGVTAVYSTQATSADSDGNTWGNEAKVVLTAASAGTFVFGFTLDKAAIVQGDIIRGGCEIDVTGASGFANVSTNLEWFPTTGGTVPTFDMFNSTLGNDAAGYTGMPFEPPALAIPAFTGSPFTNLAIRGNFNGAGAATLIVRKPWAYRAFS